MKSRFLDNIDIQLFDEFGNFIEMNGIEFTLTIVVRIFRKFRTTHDSIIVQPNISKENKKDLEKIQKEAEENEDPELELLLEK